VATLFAPDQPAIVRGDPEVGIVATARGTGAGGVGVGEGYVRLLVVDPAHRRRGHAMALLDAAEDDLSGVRTVQTGADPPYYLWPGVPSTETGMLCLFERRHYTRVEANFHMALDLTTVPDDPGEIGRAHV